MVIAGLPVVLLQSIALFSPTDGLSAFHAWQRAVSGALPVENSAYFAMFIIFTTWLFGAFSIWAVARYQNAWVGVITGAIMLFINLANLPRDNDVFFAYFFLAAVVFLGMTYLAKNGTLSITWQKHKYARRGIIYFSTAVTVITIVAVGIAYLVPEPPINNMGMNVNTASIGGVNLKHLWFNVFESVGSKWGYAVSEDKKKLLFKDRLDTSDKINFMITSVGSYYLCTQRYDVYQSWGWTSTSDTETSLSPGERINYSDASTNNQPVTYSVENLSKTDVILAAGNVISIDIPVKLLTFGDRTNIAALETPDIATITTDQLLRLYQTYKVDTYLISATREGLSAGGTDYPAWVTARYLQVPSDQAMLIAKSHQINRHADTPYDKIIAVKEYLETFTYDPYAPPVPEKSDGVDYFLYTAKRGVCTDFASAMVLMLRASGVPARLCTGYLSCELDKTTGKYIIRGKNTHAWVEVYFPNYGWITVESTPAGATVGNDQPAIPEIIDDSLALSPDSQLPWWESTTPPPPAAAPQDSGNAQSKKTVPWPVLYTSFSVLAVIAAVQISKKYFIGWMDRLMTISLPYQAYARMCYLARRSDNGPKDSETPLEFSRRLADNFPEEKENISTIVSLYIDTLYSPRKEMPVDELLKLQNAWIYLCNRLTKHMLGLKRWFPVRYLLLKWV